MSIEMYLPSPEAHVPKAVSFPPAMWFYQMHIRTNSC